MSYFRVFNIILYSLYLFFFIFLSLFISFYISLYISLYISFYISFYIVKETDLSILLLDYSLCYLAETVTK